jgi:hypothetical protein
LSDITTVQQRAENGLLGGNVECPGLLLQHQLHRLRTGGAGTLP